MATFSQQHISNTLPHDDDDDHHASSVSDNQSDIPATIPIFRTDPNSAGLFRIHRYYHPSYDPEANATLLSSCDIPELDQTLSSERSPTSVWGKQKEVTEESSQPSSSMPDVYGPLGNASKFLLFNWHYSDNGNDSNKSLDDLVHNVLLHPDFNLDDLRDFSAKRDSQRMDRYQATLNSDSATPNGPWEMFDGWKEGSFGIPIPRARHKYPSEQDAFKLDVPFFYRPPSEIIKADLLQPHARSFHWKPYKLFWKRDDSTPVQRVYGEGFTSDRALEIEEEVMGRLSNEQRKLLEEGKLEIAIILIMLYSDSTLLANFGTASLWPFYMTYANWIKYDRLKPASMSMNHVFYFPGVPDSIQDLYWSCFKHLATQTELRHCKVELIHGILHHVFSDPKFMDAYIHGTMHSFVDGKTRLSFYRFHCYSTDYVEKVMIITIKFLAKYLCGLCLTTTPQVYQLGMKNDMKRRVNKPREESDAHRWNVEAAREQIYEHGAAVDGSTVQGILGEGSYVPIRNAFSALFGDYGLDVFKMNAPDSLHDFWGKLRDVLTHHIRLLDTIESSNINILNKRFRQMPTFGTDTIRRFRNNVADMKGLAGRDFEDILQHTDSTLASFDTSTRELGDLLRRYTKAVDSYQTQETKRESVARAKRSEAKGKGSSTSGRQPKKFNNSTYKTHALGHHPQAIRYWGTTDGTSASAGEREHKRSKDIYSNTNKNDHEKQIGNKIMRKVQLKRASAYQNDDGIRHDDYEEMPEIDPEQHHQISKSQKRPVEIYSFSRSNKNDPALLDFTRKLKTHILCRLRELDPTTPLSNTQLLDLYIADGRLYEHQTLRVFYTTYDLRRMKDTVSVRTHADIMVLSKGKGHPYHYGRVVGIYHTNVVDHAASKGSQRPKRLELLWIRWYRLDVSYQYGWRAKRLPRVEFYPPDDPDAFSFIAPADVIRSVHLMPAYMHGQTSDCLPEDSVARIMEVFVGKHVGTPRRYTVEEKDWRYYHVNMFVDRDIFMRFRGGGIGHTSTLSITSQLEAEATINDEPVPVYNEDGNIVLEDVEMGEEHDREEEEEEEDGNVIDGSLLHDEFRKKIHHIDMESDDDDRDESEDEGEDGDGDVSEEELDLTDDEEQVDDDDDDGDI
ncbi:hypothetical protein VNI00_008814 [Paramarasmius palmivorus]|uniref:Uncharacterized protein n=1 Tax=Paramarasmius palmivorus TaxID=297713 RepID=A0AAW0CPF8_9AGAR